MIQAVIAVPKKKSTKTRTRSGLLTVDSIVRRFDRWAVPHGANREKLSIACFPEAGIQDVTDQIKIVHDKAAKEVLVVHNVRVNDVRRLSSGKVHRKLAALVHKIKTPKPGVSVRVCSIPEAR